MDEQRQFVRVFLDDGYPEANDYDDNYLLVGIDPVLHPDWRTRREVEVREGPLRTLTDGHDCASPDHCRCPHAA